MHLPTPDLSHLTKNDFNLVYEPAEDTFILLDALEADAERLIKSRPFFCLEIGSVHFCIDINARALQATARTFERNGLPHPNLIQTSLVEGLRTKRSIDLLLFNPPYVVTDDEEYAQAYRSGNLSASWAGGQNGMLLTDQLLQNLDSILHPCHGILYLVAIKQNNPEKIVQCMEESGFVAVIVLKRRAGGEHLHVIRIARPSAHASLMDSESVVENTS